MTSLSNLHKEQLPQLNLPFIVIKCSRRGKMSWEGQKELKTPYCHIYQPYLQTTNPFSSNNTLQQDDTQAFLSKIKARKPTRNHRNPVGGCFDNGVKKFFQLLQSLVEWKIHSTSNERFIEQDLELQGHK